MAKYTEGFKRKAVALLTKLNKKGVVIIDDTEIRNVRQLCFHLGISSWSIYNWDKMYNPKDDNSDDLDIDDDIDDDVDFFDEKEIEVAIQVPGENKVKFGIDFWMHVARNLGLKNYRKYKSLEQLKLAIGNELIRDSGLVDMNKASKKLSKNAINYIEKHGRL